MDSTVSDALRVAVEMIAQVKEEDRILEIVDDSTEFLVKELESILDRNEKKILVLSAQKNISMSDVTDRDVIFLFTRDNLCFSPTIARVVEEGKKVLCCAKCTPQKLMKSIPRNLKKSHDTTLRLVSSLRKNSLFEIMSRNGHKLTGRIDEFPPKYVGFLMDKKDGFSILPGGIIGVPIIPGTVDGEIFINGFVDGAGRIETPVILKIEAGRVRILNQSEAPSSIVESVSFPWFKPCELGIGTNPNSETSDDIHESESEYGVIDVGFGENVHIGGPIQGSRHFDITTKWATLRIDGRVIIEEGKIKA